MIISDQGPRSARFANGASDLHLHANKDHLSAALACNAATRAFGVFSQETFNPPYAL
jgi:hypothetical protein